MISKPIELSVKDIFEIDNYIIPLYQRNYSWSETEVTQLIQDIWDYACINSNVNYYIGTLVVYKREIQNKVIYETIDGQQRLTTLNILLSVLKNEFGSKIYSGYESRLKFDSRVISSNTLKILADNNKNNNENENPKMRQAYLDMSKKINQLINQKTLSIIDFNSFLLNNVQLLRVEVPNDTDQNHYFEIMNNRGEQLEKHEILKAFFLKYLSKDKDASNTFSMIWDACADMEHYVQYGFENNIRKLIFGKSWNNIPDNFNIINEIIRAQENKKASSMTDVERINFLDLLKKEQINLNIENDKNLEEKSKFNSVINFPNFLLHVLRVHTGKNIPLDDKRLLNTFKETIAESNNPVNFSKDFSYSLLKIKFIFDKYVIKREFKNNRDYWSLQRIKLSKDSKPYYKNTFDSKEPLMLLSMFHVSFPQIIYKHWLNGVLKYLFEVYDKGIIEDKYIEYLESLSDSFYFDRFNLNALDYYEIIYDNKGRPSNNVIEETHLHIGTDVQNFIFNRLDYLIWKSITILKERKFKIDNINTFEFSFRSSVEHFYPQNPKPGANLEQVSKKWLNRFGNLCLISRSKNSELSNYSPLAKAEHYAASSTIESLKQRLMILDSDNWNEKAISKHENEMISILNTHG